jgi:hypothetical protein
MRSDIQRGVISRSAPKHLQPRIPSNPYCCSIKWISKEAKPKIMNCKNILAGCFHDSKLHDVSGKCLVKSCRCTSFTQI